MTLDLILDCQYGSTGKGLFASYLAEVHQPDVIAYAPSPNAGHTFYYNGLPIVHKMLPSGICTKSVDTVVLGPGSILDLDRLEEELANLPCRRPTVLIHQNAAVVQDRHREAESEGGTAPGSTRQGTGAAKAEHIRRSPGSKIAAQHCVTHPVFAGGARLVSTKSMLRHYFAAKRLQVESAQGYSLSIYHGNYPHVTCRDVTTASILSDTGVPLMRQMNIYGTFRTYPIRVANRPTDGEHSGPCYPDSKEISFESIGQEQELTTVTKLPRRIFTWSQQQALEACSINRVDSAFLNFAQYPPTFDELVHTWNSLNEACTVQFLGFGPASDDIIRVGDPAVDGDRVRRIYERYRRAAGADRSLG